MTGRVLFADLDAIDREVAAFGLLTPDRAVVRRWRKKLIDSGVSAITVAKTYRLLRAVFNTAVDDEMIKRNPCRIKGAGNEDSPERPVLTVA